MKNKSSHRIQMGILRAAGNETADLVDLSRESGRQRRTKSAGSASKKVGMNCASRAIISKYLESGKEAIFQNDER